VGDVAPPIEPPPPQAAISAAMAPTDDNRNALGTMIDVSLVDISISLH
jgi:hypothetical protein